MSRDFVERARALTAQVLTEPGALAPDVRHAAASGDPMDGVAGDYAAKVRKWAYRVIDGDIDALHAAGYSDAQIHELTEAAAHGAAMVRLDAALAALDDGGE